MLACESGSGRRSEAQKPLGAATVLRVARDSGAGRVGHRRGARRGVPALRHGSQVVVRPRLPVVSLIVSVDRLPFVKAGCSPGPSPVEPRFLIAGRGEARLCRAKAEPLGGKVEAM